MSSIPQSGTPRTPLSSNTARRPRGDAAPLRPYTLVPTAVMYAPLFCLRTRILVYALSHGMAPAVWKPFLTRHVAADLDAGERQIRRMMAQLIQEGWIVRRNHYWTREERYHYEYRLSTRHERGEAVSA